MKKKIQKCLRGGEATTKMQKNALDLNFFTFFSQGLFHSDFDGDGVSYGLEYAEPENHNKKIVKNCLGLGQGRRKCKKTPKTDFFHIFFFCSNFDGEGVSLWVGAC